MKTAEYHRGIAMFAGTGKHSVQGSEGYEAYGVLGKEVQDFMGRKWLRGMSTK